MAGGQSYGGIVVPEGDPGGLEAAASRLQASAGVLDATAGALRGVLGGLGWMGPASAQHASLTQTQGVMVTTAGGALREQAAVINGYAVVLQQAQRAGRLAIEHAKDADRRIHQAEADIREAVAAAISAQGRITAAENAQAMARMHLFTSAADALMGDTSAAAAVDAAAAEEAAARRDLEAAQERERRARRRLEAAQEDRRTAQRAGDDAKESVDLARTGLVAAAQGAGLLPTQPGGPADAAFATAAGIKIATPPPPPKPEHKSWLERRLDDVGDAASWTWTQAKQVPGGVWEGTKGIYEGGKFILELNPTAPQNILHPGRTLDRYKQLAQTGEYAFDHPGEFGQQVINWDDLSHGRYGEWAGNLVPDVVLAVATGGAGTAATRSVRVAKAVDKLAEGDAALSRAARLKASIPVREYSKQKTFAAQAGDDGRISISGENFARHEQMLTRTGVSPDLQLTQSSAEIRAAMADAGHPMQAHPHDANNLKPDGTYNATHAELRVVLHDPTRPVGVTKVPCPPSCDPALQHLAQHTYKRDILVTHPGGPTLYRADGEVFRAAVPTDFTGVNSRWPGVLWGTGGGAAGLFAPALAP